MKNVKVKMNKPVYLGLPILEISKTLTYESWYEYMKPKYVENVKLCYVDTDSYTDSYIDTYSYKDITGDVEKRFDS